MNLLYLPKRVIVNQRETENRTLSDRKVTNVNNISILQKIQRDSQPYLRLIRFDRPIGRQFTNYFFGAFIAT